MSQNGSRNLDALNAALDALNHLEVAIRLVSEQLSGLQRSTLDCELNFASDGTLEGATHLPMHLGHDGEPVPESQMISIRHHCKWLAVYIESLWKAHVDADNAILRLPTSLVEKLDALTGSPWLASVRRNCLDLVLKWPGEIHHQTSYAAKKVFGRADELLKMAEGNAPYSAWNEFQRLLITYRHDLFAVRDAASLHQAPSPQKQGARRIDKATSARDKWIYEQCCKLVPYETIAILLKNKPKSWDRISSKQGIRAAASRHAKRNNLPEIPRRQGL